jgi:hypothetical protein
VPGTFRSAWHLESDQLLKQVRPSIYQIKVQGKLNEQWSDWLANMTISHNPANKDAHTTTLTGPVVDQTALRGIVNKLWDLNLILLSIKQLER